MKFYAVVEVCGEYKIYVVRAKDEEEAEKKVLKEIPLYATLENIIPKSEIRKIK